MDKFKAFFQVPLVKFAIHAIIIFGLVGNISYQYYTAYVYRDLSKQQSEFIKIDKENIESRNDKDYYNSDLYKERYAKELNFKKKGEDVIDTSVLEVVGDENGIVYIPDMNKNSLSSIEKWYYCFFRENQNEQVSSYTLCRA